MADIAQSVIDQRTEEWYAARRGKLTASRFADALDIPEDAGQPYKSGPRKGQPKPASSAARDSYMFELAFERRSGNSMHQIGSRSLSWGTEVEQFSKEAFEIETGLIVAPGGFQTHPRYPFIGASADGLIIGQAGLESKAPYNEPIHLQTLLRGMPDGHKEQVQGGMFVYGLPRWYFISYDPRQAEADRLFVQVIERDDIYINTVLLPGLLQFEAELQQMMKRLDSRPNLVAAAA
jgi:predicted phage-related endonuclease